MNRVPKVDRNNGYSLGLQHPYLYGLHNSKWAVWHRITGVIVWQTDGDSEIGRNLAEAKAWEFNGKPKAAVE